MTRAQVTGHRSQGNRSPQIMEFSRADEHLEESYFFGTSVWNSLALGTVTCDP